MLSISSSCCALSVRFGSAAGGSPFSFFTFSVRPSPCSASSLASFIDTVFLVPCLELSTNDAYLRHQRLFPPSPPLHSGSRLPGDRCCFRSCLYLCTSVHSLSRKSGIKHGCRTSCTGVAIGFSV
ncbi:hypothetical protein SCLCIDRAFT_322563 [Scleroderma citrinum Foug A]|uniref:Uncharacterized protein n=1 Tax=Scleroderma citrinum Foug A TaxID=1036808 RepID=A0A0C3EDQ0_9AGAM|nr:hypothetical protein SCLCIDRAFT_322563 [Scleroderma citrinum Foug A]